MILLSHLYIISWVEVRKQNYSMFLLAVRDLVRLSDIKTKWLNVQEIIAQTEWGLRFQWAKTEKCWTIAKLQQSTMLWIFSLDGCIFHVQHPSTWTIFSVDIMGFLWILLLFSSLFSLIFDKKNIKASFRDEMISRETHLNHTRKKK